MNSYESQYRPIVGYDHKPSDEMEGEQARALRAHFRDAGDADLAGWVFH